MFGYKIINKCLIILAPMGETNINRKVHNKIAAEYLCNKARVLWIENLEHGRKVELMPHPQNSEIVFKIGKIVDVRKYLKNIKFYLSVKIAILQDYTPNDGLSVKWTPIGRLKLICYYRNGKINGMYQTRYPNGKVMEEYTMKDGVRDGPCLKWYPNGKLRIECRYKNNKLDGLFMKFYQNNKTAKLCHYKNGILDGPFLTWFQDGNKSCVFHFKNGKKHGLFLRWNIEGQQDMVNNFRDNRVILDYSDIKSTPIKN